MKIVEKKSRLPYDDFNLFYMGRSGKKSACYKKIQKMRQKSSDTGNQSKSFS